MIDETKANQRVKAPSETEKDKGRGEGVDTGKKRVIQGGRAGDHVIPLVKCSRWCFLSAVMVSYYSLVSPNETGFTACWAVAR